MSDDSPRVLLPLACVPGNGMHPFNPRVLGPLALLVLLVALWSPHIRHVDALGEEEIVALAEIFASSPTLFSAYGWTQDFASACDANSTFSYTLTCADGHITRLYEAQLSKASKFNAFSPLNLLTSHCLPTIWIFLVFSVVIFSLDYTQSQALCH